MYEGTVFTNKPKITFNNILTTFDKTHLKQVYTKFMFKINILTNKLN